MELSEIESIEGLYDVNGSEYVQSELWADITGTSLRILIRSELRTPGLLIGDDQIYNVIVTPHAFIVMPVIINLKRK